MSRSESRQSLGAAAPAPRAALAARRVALRRWASVFRGTQKFLQGLNEDEVCFNFHYEKYSTLLTLINAF